MNKKDPVSPLIIGITGVAASGKSTLCRLLEREHGFHWIDADSIVKELYLKGGRGYEKIQDYFGAYFVGPREVYRGRLRRLVLVSQHKLWILNKIMHPLICHEVNKKIVQFKKLYKNKKEPLSIVIEAFYFEPGDLGKFISRLYRVDAPDRVVLQRLHKRKMSPKQAIALIKMQKKILYYSSAVAEDSLTLVKGKSTVEKPLKPRAT